ncbi:MAG: dTDP-4-dehydrorhamnose 3,5-epimerase [Chloroflexi bacterium]|nr:dTDP-4-dehydrorhamnose 3,5-epimerase [Chloroflexota bacterium]
MIFTETQLPGVYVIEIKKIQDARGFFGRAFCQNEFQALGLNAAMVQMNVGLSLHKGTLRGVHYQKVPWAEAKLVRCTKGAIYDVVIDLRSDSPTFKRWLAVELTEANHKMVYVPEGCAHGYQTLADNTEMYYQTTQFYAPEFATGVRYNDPAFGITLPLAVTLISDQDRNWQNFVA